MNSQNSSSDVQGDYRVVVFAVPDDPAELGEILVDKLKLHPTDAQIHAHAVPGLLPDKLPNDKAAELAAAIRELGVSAAVIRQAEIPQLDHAQALHHVRCLVDGLQIVGLHGEPKETVDWEEIELISIGHIPLEQRTRYQVDLTLIHSAPQPPDEATDVPAFSGPEMWLIRRTSPGSSGTERGYRLEHHEMSYEYLGERMTGSSTHNFRLLVDDLLAKTPQAYLTPAARAYAEHGLLRHYQFDSLEEHRRYTTFHLLLVHRLREEKEE